MWTLTTEHPPIGARIIALLDDGSGSDMFHVAGENEYMDELGNVVSMVLSEDHEKWALAPDGYLFFFERDDMSVFTEETADA